MSNQSPLNNPDYLAPFTGQGIDLRGITRTGIDVRSIPLSAGVHPRGLEWNYEHVFSPFARLYFARHGSISIKVEGNVYQLPRLGFLFIPAELHFHCGTTGSSEHLWIHFTVEPPWLEGLRQPVAIEGEATSRSLAQCLWRDLDARSPLNRKVHYIKSLLHLLFASLKLADHPAFPHQLLRAMEAIQKHLDKPLSVKNLSRLAGYSPEHLAHLFRKHLKQSPSACIREHRIREAARRLAYTDDTIEVIADDLCFANRHHMSRLFKSIMKEAPATFRRRFKTHVR